MFGEAAAGAAEVDYCPVISSPPAGFPPVLSDIASRLPEGTDAQDPDLVTFAHEGSHFLGAGRAGYHGLYAGNGIRIYLPTPPVLTAQVFAAIPESERGSIYETYRRQGESEYWLAQPLMVVDEWVAYTHGSIARREMDLPNRRDSDRHCAQMANYAWHLHRLAKERPHYPIKDLTLFLRWNDERCRRCIPDWGKLFVKTFD